MDCPICGKAMKKGKLVYQNRWLAGAWTPEDSKEQLKYFAQAFYNSNDSIVFSPADEGWYCPICKKTLAVFDTAESRIYGSAVNDGISNP